MGGLHTVQGYPVGSLNVNWGARDSVRIIDQDWGTWRLPGSCEIVPLHLTRSTLFSNMTTRAPTLGKDLTASGRWVPDRKR